MSANTLKLKIITPEQTVYQDEVFEVVVPTEAGEITVLPDHMPLVSVIKTGEIRIRKEGQPEPIPFSVSNGILQVRASEKDKGIETEVIVLAIRSELAEDINLDRAKKAYDLAEKSMESSKNKSPEEYEVYRKLHDKELNRIQVAEKYKK
jgi:F-type H+-transporting ATPase subunit epsilon